MREMNDKLWNEIEQLRREVERLKTQGGTGRWQSWTPVITLFGGTTDPTSLIITARYLVLGKSCQLSVGGTLTRGSGNRQWMGLTLPIDHVAAASGAVTINFNGNMVCANYFTGQEWVINLGGMTSDGYLFASANYPI